MAEGEDTIDDLKNIYQGEIRPTLEANVRTKFKPWHKPRKHYLRLNQWCHETRQLLKKLNPGAGAELRYLGLPGEDLLDIRVLKGVCKRAKVTLRYLGFDSSLASAQLNLSRHEVNSDQFIHSASVVISDRLENLALLDSVACKYVEQHAPFDVINLDLCDSVVALAEQGTVPNLEAIRTLCDVQIKRRGQPWLMFLTTRAIRGDLDTATRTKLFERLLQNILDSVDFSAQMDQKLGFNEAALRAELLPNGPLDTQTWLRAYILAISKWLLHYMMAKNYSVAVQMLPSYSYSVEHGQRDMASLAFIFDPILPPREDITGLTRPRPHVVTENQELALAKQFIDQVAKLQDIDDKLKNDKMLELSMFTKSAALLATLRYDMKAYKKFVFPDS